MITSRLSFDIAATAPDLSLMVCMDDIVIYQGHPGPIPLKINHDFDDSAVAQHVLSFVMSGKRSEHTLLSSDGEIMHDSVIIIEKMTVDGIELGHTFSQVTHYRHDTNGTTQPKTQPFYGTMGCNGRVEMHFSTPIYLWLLEKM